MSVIAMMTFARIRSLKTPPSAMAGEAAAAAIDGVGYWTSLVNR
jgi:hypothetical protein